MLLLRCFVRDDDIRQQIGNRPLFRSICRPRLFSSLPPLAAKGPLAFKVALYLGLVGSGYYAGAINGIFMDPLGLVSIDNSVVESGQLFLKQKAQEPEVVSLPSGLLYKVLKKGSGETHPGPSSPCVCHYRGTLIDGTEFDSSFKRGKPATFKPNKVVAGWTEALQLMVEGDKWELYIPSNLGFVA